MTCVTSVRRPSAFARSNAAAILEAVMAFRLAQARNKEQGREQREQWEQEEQRDQRTKR
jgi:hypothetical protein